MNCHLRWYYISVLRLDVASIDKHLVYSASATIPLRHMTSAYCSLATISIVRVYTPKQVKSNIIFFGLSSSDCCVSASCGRRHLGNNRFDIGRKYPLPGSPMRWRSGSRIGLFIRGSELYKRDHRIGLDLRYRH